MIGRGGGGDLSKPFCLPCPLSFTSKRNTLLPLEYIHLQKSFGVQESKQVTKVHIAS